MKRLPLAITTGDIDGIGTEVASKALQAIGPSESHVYFLWRSSFIPKNDLDRIDSVFERATVQSVIDGFSTDLSPKNILIDIESELSPALWVEQVARLCMDDKMAGLVTAPLSKTEIVQSGLNDNGHTGILKRISNTKNVFMSFLGEQMNVTLLTGHQSPRRAYDSITKELLTDCIEKTSHLASTLDSEIRQKPVAIVGSSPHAGEEGVIDDLEDKIYRPVIEDLKTQGLNIEGPLVPDVCFQASEREKYAYYVASYHDQGLIPFKMLHGTQSGIQYSLGLPFIRTSVDHGTAKDIFGKETADFGSMKAAIEFAIEKSKQECGEHA